MKLACPALLLAALLAASAQADDDEPGPAPAATATVRSIVPASRHFTDSVSGYGLVTSQPGASLSLSRPLPGQIENLRVSLGQRVAAGEAMFDFLPDAASSQAWTQAESAVRYAERELQRQQQLLRDHLSSQGQVDSAEHALHDAQAARQSLQAQGAGRQRQTISTPFAGVVSSLSVNNGDRVAAAAPLLQLQAGGKGQVELGIEPGAAAAVRAGQNVDLSEVFNPGQHWQGKVLRVAGQLNAQSHLLDVAVQLPAGAPVSGSRLLGRISTGAHDALAVPHAAVFSDEQGQALYTIVAGKAHRLSVSTGAENDGWLPLSTPLPAGSRVVVEGQYNLSEGLAVKEAQP